MQIDFLTREYEPEFTFFWEALFLAVRLVTVGFVRMMENEFRRVAHTSHMGASYASVQTPAALICTKTSPALCTTYLSTK